MGPTWWIWFKVPVKMDKAEPITKTVMICGDIDDVFTEEEALRIRPDC